MAACGRQDPAGPERRSPCERPRAYALGEADERFELSKTERLEALAEAAALWNAARPRPLFAYDPDSALKVDFSYDERQALDAAASQQRGQIEQRQAQMGPELERLKADAAAFSARQEALNARIGRWNDGGGGGPEELAALKAERSALDAEFEVLKRRESFVRGDADAVDAQAKLYNQTLSTFNEAIRAKPEQGLYEGGRDRITIYFSGSRKELVHTLAHELGHALGLHHNAGASGIMYPNTTESLSLSDDDRQALSRLCSTLR